MINLVTLLREHRYSEGTEDALQRGVESVLAMYGYTYLREFRLTPQDRVDFLVEVGPSVVGVECKIGGSRGAVIRQLMRYAEHATIDALILVTAKGQLAAVPGTLNRKEVFVVATMGGIR